MYVISRDFVCHYIWRVDYCHVQCQGSAQALSDSEVRGCSVPAQLHMLCAVHATTSLLHVLAAVGLCGAAAVLAAGKELIENLTVLRFSNRVFEPLWSRQYIRNVQVSRVMSCCR
jgi:hypothetical protein